MQEEFGHYKISAPFINLVLESAPFNQEAVIVEPAIARVYTQRHLFHHSANSETQKPGYYKIQRIYIYIYTQ